MVREDLVSNKSSPVTFNLSPKGGIKSSPRDFYSEPLHLTVFFFAFSTTTPICFALYFNVSKNMVSDWERGIKKPGGPALRLLGLPIATEQFFTLS